MIDFSKVFSKRITAFPVFTKEPKKEPDHWALCPEFKVRPESLSEGMEYRYPVTLYGASLLVLRDILDMTITAGREEIEVEKEVSVAGEPITANLAFWLHAADIEGPARVKGKDLWGAKIVFVYRLKLLKYLSEQPEETGSISEIPKISEEILSHPPETKKSEEEVKENA